MSERKLRFVIIGAGMAGIMSGIKLREAGYDDWVVYEKAPKAGGTWFHNTYPGLSCDVPSHIYSYAFEPNPDWSHRSSPGAEIRAYFENVARKRPAAAGQSPSGLYRIPVIGRRIAA